MKIGFDISAQSLPRSGVGQYQINLLKSLLKIDKEDIFRFFAFNLRNRRRFDDIKFDSSNYDIKVIPIPQRSVTLWWMFAEYPKLESFCGDCDVIQVSEICMQPVKKAKTVAFIHDLTTILFPENHVRSNVIVHSERFRKIGRSDAILTNSEFTKADIVKHLNIRPEKIYVTHLGADERFKSSEQSDILQTISKFRIKTPYILFTGTIEPRKNLKVLIQAFNKLKSDKQVPHNLVLAGQKGWKYEDIFAEISKSPFKSDILHIGYVPDADVPHLMSGADVFVYPSLYEGFGLPVLEAMKCGAPVITSNVSSLPEVGGEACLYAEPSDVAGIAEKLFAVISDPAFRKTLAEKGIIRAKNFSWDKCAEVTMKVYKAVAGK